MLHLIEYHQTVDVKHTYPAEIPKTISSDWHRVSNDKHRISKTIMEGHLRSAEQSGSKLAHVKSVNNHR